MRETFGPGPGRGRETRAQRAGVAIRQDVHTTGSRLRRAGRHRLRPGLLELEGRRLLATFTVTSTADDGGAGTLRSAIAEANVASGATTIDFDPTVFATPQTITLSGSQLELSNPNGTLTITGPAAGVTVSGGGLSRVLQVDAGVTTSISGVTLTGGEVHGNGGALYNSGTVSLTGCTISGNTAASSDGGGLFSSGTTSLTNCTVSSNAASYGGGLENKSGTMTLTDCTIADNGSGNLSGGTTGGGIYNRATVTLTDCTVTGNTGYTGGGLKNGSGSTADLTDCTFNANSAKYSGGLGNYGTVTLTDSTVSSNVAWLDDGGLSNTGTVDLTNCLVSGNQAGIACGGLSTIGIANLTDCTISGNASQTNGGGLANGESEFGSPGELVLTDCTISGNSTKNGGGGLFDNGVVTTLTACTISGNSASKNGGGLFDDGPMTLTACTVSGNMAANGGGLYNQVGTTLIDTIIAGNTLPNSSIASDIDGKVATASSYNLLGTGGSGGLQTGVTGNIVLGNLSTLGLAPLGSYGGPTQTMALLPGSAAIGEGTAVSGVTTDQRGEPLDSPIPDIGAFQTQKGLVVDTTTDSTGSSSGALSLRQAVNLANLLDVAATITFDATVFTGGQTIALTQGPLALGDTGGTLTITGPAEGLIVSGGGDGRVFDVAPGATASISGLTITGGSTSLDGGGLYNQGMMTLTDCTISENSAEEDGGGLAGDGTATLTDCTISGNSADDGGGLDIGGTASLTGCTISGNSAGGTGGGLYDQGTATLEDTIVAGNTGSGGSASDIAGSVSGSSSYNLIGTGGAGGLTNGADHNIILTGLAGLGLAPLGDYGGPTETMALLPGSVAIGAGTAVSGIATDERGASRPTSGAVDLGAFQDQGYTVAVSSGSPQLTMVNSAFGAPLVAVLTENFVKAPLPGVTIDFSAPSSGAGATLSASSAIANASGLASITATANATAGAYAVTASAPGVASTASFELTNQIQPSFSGLTNPTVTYGSTLTVSGTLAAGSQVPVGGNVVVTVDGGDQNATILPDGSFSAQFTSDDGFLNASSTAYIVTYEYAGGGGFLEAEGSSQLTVNREALTITAVANTKVYDGTTIAAALPTITSGSLATGDTDNFTESYSTKNAGTGLTLTPSGSVDNGKSKNYTITFVSVSTGVITPAPLTITATSDTKVYDGTTASSQTPTDSGLISAAGDTVTGLTEAFASKNVLGTDGSTLTVTGYTVNDGDGGKDYTVTTQDASGTITPAALTITATGDAKVYDGTTTSSQTPTYGTLYGGDTVTGLTQAFDSKNVLGTDGSTLIVTDYTINDGDDGKDYTVTTQSAAGTITPAALTITATGDTKVYDGTTISSQAPTDSGLIAAAGDTVTGLTEAFASKNVLGADGSALIVTGYSVNDGDGGNDYTVTTQDASGTITPAALTIAANDQTKVYGAALPTLTASYSGFVGGDTPAILTTQPTPTTTALASSPVSGSPYTITVAGAVDPDYSITYVPGRLTVTPAALTITANDQTKVYGAALSTLTASYSGFVNGDTSASLTTQPTLSTTAAADSHVAGGPYAITVGGAADSNYTISYVAGSLTVTPAALTITANDQTKVYGAALPTLTASYSGFVNGDTPASLTTRPTLSTTATADSHVAGGPYAIIAGGAVDPDYSIAYVPGHLTVTPASLTIAANDQTKVYGAALPALTYTITGFVGGDSSSVLSGAPAIATTATAGSGVGSYAITVAAGTLSDSDYTFPAADLIAGTLTVTPAPLVISAVSTSMMSGQPVPALMAAYMGFVNGDTAASLATAPVLQSTATSSSAPGSYPITVGGARSPNYTITYVPGTLTVVLPPATVESVSVEKVKLTKHKTVQEIVVRFSEALDPSAAQDINAYTLATVPKNKKQKSKAVPIAGASYNASAFTVTLLTAKKLSLNPPLDLTVKAASLLDAFGRELDGNDSGQPGANFTAVLSKAGASVTSERALARIGGLSSHAVDAVLAEGVRRVH
jgi:predicted outer membrane repeat protein